MPILQLKEEQKKEEARTDYFTSVFAGIFSLIGRHPLDTAASRIKANANFSYSQWQQVVFPNNMNKFCSLYKGLGAASVNRFSQLISMELQRPFEHYMNGQLQHTFKNTNDDMTLSLTRSFTSIAFGTLTALFVCIPNQYKISRQLGTKVVNPAYALPPTICRNTVWFLAHSLSEKPLHFALSSLKIAEKNPNVQQNLEDFTTAVFASFVSVPFDRCKILIQSGQLPPGTIKALSHIIKLRTPFQGAGIECLLQMTGVGLFYTAKALLNKKKTDKEKVSSHRSTLKP